MKKERMSRFLADPSFFVIQDPNGKVIFNGTKDLEKIAEEAKKKKMTEKPKKK